MLQVWPSIAYLSYHLKFISKIYIFSNSVDGICKVSSKMLDDLTNNCFVLSDLTIANEEIDVLCNFLASSVTSNSLETFIITKTIGSHSGTWRGGTRDNIGALIKSRLKLYKAVMSFIEKSKSLHSVIIDGISMTNEMIEMLGSALKRSKSAIRWLSIKSSPIGNSGFKTLYSFIQDIPLQVLILENCNLSDASSPCITSIIKSQESYLDSLFWNATLRTYPSVEIRSDELLLSEEMAIVHSSGLVALSIAGNSFTGKEFKDLFKNLKRNQWFLGLNVSNNKLSKESLEELRHSVAANNVMSSLVLEGNKGLTPEVNKEICACMNISNVRLDLLPEGVSLLLRRWIKQSNVVNDSLRPSSSYSPEYDASVNLAQKLQRSVSTPNLLKPNLLKKPTRIRSAKNRREILNPEGIDDMEISYVLNALDGTGDNNGLSDYIILNEDTKKVNEVVTNRESMEDSFELALPSPPGHSLDNLASLSSPPKPPNDAQDNRPMSRISIRPRPNLVDSMSFSPSFGLNIDNVRTSKAIKHSVLRQKNAESSEAVSLKRYVIAPSASYGNRMRHTKSINFNEMLDGPTVISPGIKSNKNRRIKKASKTKMEMTTVLGKMVLTRKPSVPTRTGKTREESEIVSLKNKIFLLNKHVESLENVTDELKSFVISMSPPLNADNNTRSVNGVSPNTITSRYVLSTDDEEACEYVDPIKESPIMKGLQLKGIDDVAVGDAEIATRIKQKIKTKK